MEGVPLHPAAPQPSTCCAGQEGSCASLLRGALQAGPDHADPHIAWNDGDNHSYRLFCPVTFLVWDSGPVLREPQVGLFHGKPHATAFIGSRLALYERKEYYPPFISRASFTPSNNDIISRARKGRQNLLSTVLYLKVKKKINKITNHPTEKPKTKQTQTLPWYKASERQYPTGHKCQLLGKEEVRSVPLWSPLPPGKRSQLSTPCRHGE